jgi:hypothetical protein
MLAYPPGTHFYHTHKSYFVTDDASAMSIVNPKDTSSQRQLFLRDWWHVTPDQQAVGLLSVPFIFVGSPGAILVQNRFSSCWGNILYQDFLGISKDCFFFQCIFYCIKRFYNYEILTLIRY